MRQKSPLTVGRFHRAQHHLYRPLASRKAHSAVGTKKYIISYNVFQISIYEGFWWSNPWLRPPELSSSRTDVSSIPATSEPSNLIPPPTVTESKGAEPLSFCCWSSSIKVTMCSFVCPSRSWNPYPKKNSHLFVSGLKKEGITSYSCPW